MENIDNLQTGRLTSRLIAIAVLVSSLGLLPLEFITGIRGGNNGILPLALIGPTIAVASTAVAQIVFPCNAGLRPARWIAGLLAFTITHILIYFIVVGVFPVVMSPLLGLRHASVGWGPGIAISIPAEAMLVVGLLFNAMRTVWCWKQGS